ncbi:sensor histidine kinase [Candidatus Pristimantibacillus sp. PTI5]|uniref:sensor histidine kinase n=1 Tax=Candidatus Pristimantibacillus sp. PTI5 TaxID=3400422 RepID=UPI003B02810C
MNALLPHISRNSLRFKLTALVMAIILPILALLLYNTFYAIDVVRDQVAQSNKNLISLYMGQIDDRLADVDNYLISLAATNLDLQNMSDNRSPKEELLSQIRLSRKLSDDVLVYKTIDSLFIYMGKDDLLEGINLSASYNQREAVRDYLKNHLHSTDQLSKDWSVQKLGDEYYLLRILATEHSYVGAWVDINQLLMPLKLINLGEKGVSLMVTDKGIPTIHAELVNENRVNLNRSFETYYMSGEKKHFLVVGERSMKGNFSLLALIPDEQILKNLPYLQQIVTFISLGSILLLPIFLIMLRKTVLRPLNRIISAMKLIGEGNLNIRIQPYRTSDEYQVVNHSFNNMMTQIEELRISVYEEQINKQKAELQHLQLQINPHFFMNSLNIIYALARSGKTKVIEEITLCLVQYFRYMFRSNLSVVPLQDELKHVRNYLRIQELRSPTGLIPSIEVHDNVADVFVPPLLIQSFVENTIKHAVTLDTPVYLFIDIRMDHSGVASRVHIEIRDSGEGFSQEMLQQLRGNEPIRDDQGEHIGIRNIQQRLYLLYEGQADILFYNGNPSGAVIEIHLPLEPNNLKKVNNG